MVPSTRGLPLNGLGSINIFDSGIHVLEFKSEDSSEFSNCFLELNEREQSLNLNLKI